jgi:hypothetical protein
MGRHPSLPKHLELRESGYYWRRRLPNGSRGGLSEKKFGKMSLIFSVRSNIPSNARSMALKLTCFTDIAFALVRTTTMALKPELIDGMLEALCRFQIDAAEAAREMAPTRSAEAIAYEARCGSAALDTLRSALACRDREIVRQPLRDVAARLGVVLDETDPDYSRLAYRALRVMLDVEEENIRRDAGLYTMPTPYLAAVNAPPTSTNHSVAALGYIYASPVPSRPVLPSQSSVAAQSADMTLPPDTEDAPTETAAGPVIEMGRKAQQSKTILQMTEEYIEKRSMGYRTFRPKEQIDAKVGGSWLKNSAPNVRAEVPLDL